MSSKSYFDDMAEQWERMRRGFFSEKVREKAYAVAGVQPGACAADLGAGTGFITEGLLSRGLQVIAVDQSESMLAVMRDRFVGQPGIDYRQGDADRLPLNDQSVDYAFANMYLHHVETPARAIHEMARILKPGGRLVITDLDEHRFDFLRAEHHDRWMGFRRDDVKAWIEAAGLLHADVDCVGENCYATSNSGCGEAAVSIFVASGVKMTTNSVIQIQNIDVHTEVREHYADHALGLLDSTNKPSCCGETCACGYSAEELAGLPQDVAQASWGCGDPISLAALQPGQRVLDLGSGGGLDCLLAGQRVGSTGWVIGVDMTPEMLSLAWRNAAKAGLRNVEFRYGHIEKLPVESGTIDVILSNCVINLSPDKPAVFREAFRVLKPGGKFAVSDIVSDGEMPESARMDLVSLSGCISGAMKEADYLAAIHDAGFGEVRVADRQHYADVPDSDVKTYSVRVEAHKR